MSSAVAGGLPLNGAPFQSDLSRSIAQDHPPAEQQARDIGQRIPADRQRPQMNQTGSMWG